MVLLVYCAVPGLSFRPPTGGWCPPGVPACCSRRSAVPFWSARCSAVPRIWPLQTPPTLVVRFRRAPWFPVCAFCRRRRVLLLSRSGALDALPSRCRCSAVPMLVCLKRIDEARLLCCDTARALQTETSFASLFVRLGRCLIGCVGTLLGPSATVVPKISLESVFCSSSSFHDRLAL